MLENEISETYHFFLDSFNEKGINRDGVTFRDVIKDCERDFHARHSADYALNLYANSRTMNKLARSCDAAPFLLYGMNLTQGKVFDAEKDPCINHYMDKFSQNIYVYGIDSAFMTDYDDYNYPIINVEKGIYPLTLLVDETMINGDVRLSVPTIDGDESEVDIVDSPKYEFVL